MRLYGSPVPAGAPAFPLFLEAFHAERLAVARRLQARLDAHDCRQNRQGYGHGYRTLGARREGAKECIKEERKKHFV